MANKTSKKKAAAKAIQRNVEKTVRKSLRKKGVEKAVDKAIKKVFKDKAVKKVIRKAARKQKLSSDDDSKLGTSLRVSLMRAPSETGLPRAIGVDNRANCRQTQFIWSCFPA